MRQLQLPNVFIFWSYRFSPVVDAVKALQRMIGGEGPGGSLVSNLSKVIGDLDGVATFAARKALFGEGIPVEELELWYVAEQQPSPKQPGRPPRLDRDALWNATGRRGLAADQGRQNQSSGSFSPSGERDLDGLDLAGSAPHQVAIPTGTPSDFHPNEHHMGTTRMHADRRQGVVDEKLPRSFGREPLCRRQLGVSDRRRQQPDLDDCRAGLCGWPTISSSS